jgi:hypothetical protein
MGQGLKVSVEGDANFSGTTYTISEAGENFSASIASESSVYVSVESDDYWDKKNNRNKKWQIFIHKSDLTWDNNIDLEVKRTGKGNNVGNKGNPNIHDGEDFLKISNTSTYFFRGKNEVAFIPIEIKLSGVSLSMGAKDFETNIVLTVYDDW